ncbi:hypothetical protein RFI_30351 [Reticulomyxa filosa]|uniref:NACHT domain-containing protein n=1 Tax=Reticulomyxa filosa TaxID=46433 RepID=X6M0A9_RETFI|nr:hypothetical protein RFI_30351 [Reticulomyxa filosa]|eukprot:ETO07041.1 hypothetical protein RFI_30351 [Reticulomyxa filosa]
MRNLHTFRSLEDLITRSEEAMVSKEILKFNGRITEILYYSGKAIAMVILTLLRKHLMSGGLPFYVIIRQILQTTVAVMKKAEQFNLIVSEYKDFFERQSKTHHRFHNIKLYATLKHFTTLEGYTLFGNPKLNHLFYEHIRAWKPNNSEEEDLKHASDGTLAKINDIICEWTCSFSFSFAIISFSFPFACPGEKVQSCLYTNSAIFNDTLLLISAILFLNNCGGFKIPMTEWDIILQALKGKHISNEIMDAIREEVSFVFIMDGFDEIFDFYRTKENEKYFYDHFNLNQWKAKVIITCRSKVLSNEDINTTLIGANKNQNITTSMMYLWPFTKRQMHDYIEKFAIMKSKNNNKEKKDDNNDWTVKKYDETLKKLFQFTKNDRRTLFLQLILTVLPLLVRQYGLGSRISKAQVYEVFNDQCIDIHTQDIKLNLANLRIQMNMNKIKSTLKQYCLDLGFEMFYQGDPIAIEPDFQNENNNSIWSKLDPKMENETKSVVDEKIMDETTNTSVAKTQNIWEKYFHGDSIVKYILRRVGENKYQFLHKSCQEYYAQKIIFDIISWLLPVLMVLIINNFNNNLKQMFQNY